jgi:hypothetical protein
MRGQRIDSLLAPLLQKAEDEEADEFLARLIAAHAEPVINCVFVTSCASVPAAATRRPRPRTCVSERSRNCSPDCINFAPMRRRSR